MQLRSPEQIENDAQLEDLLSEPTDAVVELMSRLQGDIVFLGIGGKIGPSIARMARRASDAAGVQRRIIGVSRFSSGSDEAQLNAHDIETIRCDLLDEEAVAQLPLAPNVVYLAGLKFGSTENASATWAMNTYLPGAVCRRYRESRIVAYSTGTVYGLTRCDSGGSRETETPEPIGEYAMSCLGRERMFEYFSRTNGTPVALIRLFYACELRYGVLVDLAQRILAGEPIDLAMGCFNTIWQGDNNAMTLLAFDHAASPPFILNLTGAEHLSTREVCEKMGALLHRKPQFTGAEQETACIANASLARELFGAPRVGPDQLIEWVCDWMKRGNRLLGKPTHFEVRDGKF